MNYKIDCVFYIGTNTRLRPYCHKLNKEIRVRDCDDCGYFRRFTQPRSDIVELGLGSIMSDDIKRLRGKE